MNNQGPYIIAEIGVNHENDLNKAVRMLRAAKSSGANAVKFQSYKAETLAAKNSPAYWDLSKEKTESQYKLFKKYDRFGEKEYEYLAEVCSEVDIDFLSTPFDFSAVDYLDNLVSKFKVASADIVNLQFLKHIASKGKPVILSCGASTIGEVSEAVTLLRDGGIRDISILHCILAYPTEVQDANLNMIRHLKASFPECKIGYSDHTLPDNNMIILTTAFLNGADIIEKHFTLDKALPGNDHYHAMDPEDLKKFVSNIKIILEASGRYYKEPMECEMESRLYARRSLVARCDIEKGKVLTEKHLINKRPGSGLPSRMFDFVVGARAKVDIKEDTMISLEMLDFTHNI